MSAPNGKHCQSCDKDLVGHQKKWCLDCNPDKANKKRNLKVANPQLSFIAEPIFSNAWQPIAFAIALGTLNDKQSAAQAVGIDLSDTQLINKLEKRALSDLKPFYDKEQSALNNLGTAFLGLNLCMKLSQVEKIPVGQRGAMSKQVIEALAALENTSAKKSYTTINLFAPGEDDGTKQDS